MGARSRREGRERALSLLYEADAKQAKPTEVLADLPVEPESFVVDLVRGVEAGGQRIDTLISEASIDWALERMPVVDRLLLRMATFELLERGEVPTGAVISEAVELAKVYSTEESGRFVNGVLASIAGRTRAQSGTTPPPEPPG